MRVRCRAEKKNKMRDEISTPQHILWFNHKPDYDYDDYDYITTSLIISHFVIYTRRASARARAHEHTIPNDVDMVSHLHFMSFAPTIGWDMG